MYADFGDIWKIWHSGAKKCANEWLESKIFLEKVT
jgi:hypothetical protein